MNSFGILRTNVGLTTNIKVMVTSNYNLFLDSIDSDPQLSSTKYKKIQFNKNTYYDEILPSFYNGLPIDIAYKVKYDDDNDNMFNTFDKQFDDIYQMGCRNIINNKNYSEEFECFAPLYLGNDSIPKNFIIFRIDGPGLTTLNKDNFRSEIIDKLKCVTIFDLTRNTPLGEWIEKNFTKNNYFPLSPFYMDYRNLEFSSWNGIDYEVGGYANKSFFLDSTLEYENTFYDFEKLIYDGYKNNKVVFPNILNLSFLFDDTPATPDTLRKWSINRYMGFYIDNMELVKTVSPYLLPDVRNDAYILGGNLLYSPSSENPFVDNWDSITTPYIEVNGNFYKVERYSRHAKADFNKIQLSNTVYSDEVTQKEIYYYKVISDVDLMGTTYNYINSNLVEVYGVTQSEYSIIKLSNDDPLIPEYETADAWIIEIDNNYHVVKKVDGVYYIQSDYAFSMYSDKFQYWINSNDPSYRKTIDLNINNVSTLVPFKIYRCNFSNIKDFDTSIVDTKYSKFEYENYIKLTNTDEPKMYTTNYSSKNNPREYNDYIIDGKVTNIPTSSEYTANGETFRIIDNDLSPLWRKNQVRNKWGYQNSLSSNDYPYLLNNSFIGEDYNRSVNPFYPLPDRKERNLDYFYTVNSSTASYIYHSLHVENVIDRSIDKTFKFDLNEYITASYDYFSYFFGKKSTFDYGDFLFNTEKWSIFDKGDNVIPNITLFRGLKFNIYDVSDIKSSGGNIDAINLNSLNTYQGYKFSILLSKNDYSVAHTSTDISVGEIVSVNNTLEWYIINKWSHNKSYSTGDIVLYYDILYVALNDSNISDPNKNPSTETLYWGVNAYSLYSPFFVPGYTYTNSSGNMAYIYNSGEYYYYNPSDGYTIWNPFNTYTYNDVVLYNNKSWISSTQSNSFQPGSSNVWSTLGGLNYYWTESNKSTDWSVVEIWSPLYSYSYDSYTEIGQIQKPNSIAVDIPGKPYVVHNEVLYQLQSSSSSNETPGVSSVWKRIYSFSPDTTYQYSSIDNPILIMNNRYYMCTSDKGSTLDNGIAIYINKKYKNVLINIYVNDNTLSNIDNCDRDSIYNDLFSNITAVNFANALSDLSNKFGFSDYLKYVIINEDDTINIYDFDNISSLPCIVLYQHPDLFYSRVQSLSISPLSLESSQFKAKRTLDNGNITTIDMLNYYNNNSLSTEINKIKNDPSIVENYHGLKNNIYNTLYRHSGYYSPIFYNIPLFEAPSVNLIGNYKFDTSLTEFGVSKERVISKINRNDNILKLKYNPDIRSIYPMIDEFGYTMVDYFIFKSSWDYEYYIECQNIDQTNLSNLSTNKILKSE